MADISIPDNRYLYIWWQISLAYEKYFYGWLQTYVLLMTDTLPFSQDSCNHKGWSCAKEGRFILPV